MPRLAMVALLLVTALPVRASEPKADLFAKDNLVAWCIVPFDKKNRSPVERADMLARLGFKRFAYDWRATHLPTFDEEVRELQKRGIELTAVWFPANLGPDAKALLEVIAKHKLTPQLWVSLPSPAGADQAAKVDAAAKNLRPIAEEAAKLGCKVGIYNHGGWAGEPENMLAIVEALKLPNVGIVYNQHHGHSHIDRFPTVLKAMIPHLLTLNINGMTAKGDAMGKKILPLGEGDLDPALLKTIRVSGYRGYIGILGHTDDDAEERLSDNLDGLTWLLAKESGKDAAKPTWRTYKAK